VFWHNRLGLPDPDPGRSSGLLVGVASSLRPLLDLVRD